MKYTLILILSFLPLCALTIEFNSAQEGGLPYGVLHIKHDEPVPCKITDLEYGKKRYTCKFNNALTKPPESKKTPLMEIEFVQKKTEFEVVVTPSFNSKLLNMDVALYAFEETPLEPKKDAKHWAILIYSKLPFTQVEIEDGINFPIFYPEYKRPNIGALDLNGAPIGYVRSKDINAYLNLKRSYEAKRYEDVIEDAQQAMMLYPQTIFKSEFALYRIRAMDFLLENEDDTSYIKVDRNDVVNEGKRWMKTFPSDEFMPEVLFYIAKNYLKMGFSSDANYFLDILITEHPQNRFTKWGILLYADYLYGGSKKAEALKLYNDVLYSAKDLNMASQAAIRLAKNSIDSGKVEEAKQFLTKILNANAEFLLTDEQGTYELAQKLAINGLEDIAAQVAEELLKEAFRTNPMYESLLKDTGLWHGEAKNISKAHEYLSRYQKEFASGEYEKEVQEGMDRLFFELSETNTTKLEAYYDTLAARYENEISEKALVEKAKLFVREKRFLEALGLDKKVREVNEEVLLNEGIQALSEAALNVASQALKEDKCQEAVLLIEQYKILEKLEDKEAIFDCLLRLSRFELAIKEAKNHINKRDLRERLAWMIRLNSALKESKQWEDVVVLSKDIYNLGILVKEPKAKSALREEFFANIELKQTEKALEVARAVQKELSGEYKNIEVYDALISLAKEQGSDLLIVEYANLAIELQEKSSTYNYSPNVEYAAMQALERLGRIEEALEIAKSLPLHLSSENEQIKAQYHLGELNYKLTKLEDAKEAFTKCSNMDIESPWRQMCQDYLELIK